MSQELPINPHRMIKDFFLLGKMISPSLREKPMVDLLSHRLIQLGADEVLIDQSHLHFGGSSGNLLATFSPKGDFSPEKWITLSAHCDSHCQADHPILPILERGYFRGANGTILGADDKAGVLAILEGVTSFLEKNRTHRPGFQILFTVAEEEGMLGATYLETTKLKGNWIFVFDGDQPAGTILNSGPGVKNPTGKNLIPWKIYSNSPHKPAKSSPPRKKSGNRSHPFKIIQGGGLGERELFSEFHGEAIVPIQNHFHFNPFFHKPQSPIVQFLFEVINQTGWIKPELDDCRGISDSQIFNQKGFCAVNLGMGVEGAHSPNERVSLNSLLKNSHIAYSILEKHCHG